MLCVQLQSYGCMFGTWKVCLELDKWKMEQNTKDAAHKTQIDRQEEKKTCTHDTDSWRQAIRQGMCVRETEVIIGKAPRLGIHTPLFPLNGFWLMLLLLFPKK